jgi:hypothetical protein
MKPLPYLHHLTVNTGDCVEQNPGDVSDEAIAAVMPLVKRGGKLPEPFGAFRVEMVREAVVPGAVFKVYRGADPIMCCWLCWDIAVAEAIWGEVFDCYPELVLASARRRAYFEWHPEEIQAVATAADALGLAHGRHLSQFKDAGLRDVAANSHLSARLCRGISRLEDLPLLALARSERGRVPLKVSPRTPTESIFWVEKLLESFALEAELEAHDSHLPVLHRRLRLTYTYQNGRKEVLSMGYELFHTLLELESGFQLNDTTSDDLFANLAIFTQRLAQEGEASLFAWSPQDEQAIYKIAVGKTAERQSLICGTAGEEA